MAGKAGDAAPTNPAVLAMRQSLARKIVLHAAGAGEQVTAVPGLTLFYRTAPTACYRASYEPSLTVFVQGKKRIHLGGTEYLCDDSSFLLSSIDVPVQSQILEASEKVPLLTMLLRLDMPAVREVLSRDDAPLGKPGLGKQGLGKQGLGKQGMAVGVTNLGLLDACGRLLDLLDAPEDIPFLSRLLQQEILYRILRTPQAERLRAIARSGDLSQRTARAIAWLRVNFARPLHMEELAEVAGMGVSTLHHQFRALTAMSPLQYQKQLRLQTARQRMLMDGLDATTAAYDVGYESVSQFSREYSRFFGQPPMRDIKALKDHRASGASAA